jgi:hypothetical protein
MKQKYFLHIKIKLFRKKHFNHSYIENKYAYKYIYFQTCKTNNVLKPTLHLFKFLYDKIQLVQIAKVF